ncbi:MAG: AMP-dependent synthetase/ligase [Ignavibacteria bacterium]
MKKRTLTAFLLENLERFNALEPVIFTKIGDSYIGASRLEIINKTFAVREFLNNQSLGKNDKVAIISENRIEWVITDLACILSGIVTVPVYTSLSAEATRFILKDSEVKVCFVSSLFQFSKILRVLPELPLLRKIVIFDKGDYSEHSIVTNFENIVSNCLSYEISALIKKISHCDEIISEEDLVTIIYTSGTMGVPKGVMLTHKNIYSNVKSCMKVLEINENDVFLSYLPYSHIYERTAGYYLAFFSGAKIYYAQSIDTIGKQIEEVRPTIVITVPRLLDRMYNRLLKSVDEMNNSFKKKIFLWAIDVALKYWNKKNSIKWTIANKIVFKKIRAKTGGRVRFLVSGGGALNKNIGQFFEGIGLTTLEGYGLTEASPVVSVNRPDRNIYGTIGEPLDGVEVTLAKDGEILVKGDSVMKGYYNNEMETQKAIVDGWLHTGDIGEWVKNNHLKITDRKKSLFKSSGGKYIAPSHIEDLIMQIPYIDQVIVIGNQRMYVTALIVPDREELIILANKLGIVYENINQLYSHPQLLKVIEKDLNEVQKELSSFEKVRKFTLLEAPFTIESGELTPTFKVKRKFIEEKYKDIIDKMYHRV